MVPDGRRAGARRFLPSPFEVGSRFIQLLTTPFAGSTLPAHLLSSFQRYATGVLLAAVIGVPLGLLMGWFRLLDDIVTPVFDALRFIAPIAWVPFAALWFGTASAAGDDHLRRRLPALPDQCLPRRALRGAQDDRGGAHAGHRQTCA